MCVRARECRGFPLLLGRGGSSIVRYTVGKDIEGMGIVAVVGVPGAVAAGVEVEVPVVGVVPSIRMRTSIRWLAVVVGGMDMGMEEVCRLDGLMIHDL